MDSTLPLSLFLVIKINLDSDGIRLIENFQQIENYQTFKIIAINLLPGAIIISLYIFWSIVRNSIITLKDEA